MMIIDEKTFDRIVNIRPTTVKDADSIVAETEATPAIKKAGYAEPHYCRQCVNLIHSRCREHNFKPVDDLPRNCREFSELTNNESGLRP
jgi:hypothetical protein